MKREAVAMTLYLNVIFGSRLCIICKESVLIVQIRVTEKKGFIDLFGHNVNIFSSP